MITLDNIHYAYGRNPVLCGFSLELQPRQVTLLVGANGAGKSTALKVATGQLRPRQGEVRIGTASLRKQRVTVQRSISFLPQDVTFHPKLRVIDVLRFYASVRGVSRERIDEEVARWGLAGHLHKPGGHLSGGLRQRLGLAVMALPDVPVWILDEPGISLDPEWRARMQGVLLAEATAGRTVLVATHLLGEWQGRAHRCLLCRDGRVAAELDPANLRSLAADNSLQLRAI